MDAAASGLKVIRWSTAQTVPTGPVSELERYDKLRSSTVQTVSTVPTGPVSGLERYDKLRSSTSQTVPTGPVSELEK